MRSYGISLSLPGLFQCFPVPSMLSQRVGAPSFFLLCSMKDTRTKPKGVGLRVGGGDGWGRGAWWGENGDNCT